MKQINLGLTRSRINGSKKLNYLLFGVKCNILSPRFFMQTLKINIRCISKRRYKISNFSHFAASWLKNVCHIQYKVVENVFSTKVQFVAN